MTIRLLVGLGNPGPEYEATRHNAGFWWLDAVAGKLRASLQPDRAYHGLVARINRPGAEPLWLLEPMTFMNLSGKSVAALARFFKSAAGHNGLKDIHAQLGTQDFWRLRLGIGHPGVKTEVPNYVLKKPSPEHRTEMEKALDRALDSLELMLAGDMAQAMMKVHADKPPRPKPPRPDAVQEEKAP
jgi:PTH1 family peptidyl-tRNA hydrolase